MSVDLQLVKVLTSPSSSFQSNSRMDFFSQSVEFYAYNFLIGKIMIRLNSCKYYKVTFICLFIDSISIDAED
jgi:hypothetical protein